jgi:hypothetical protein
MFNFSRLVSILTAVVGVLTLVIHYAGGFIPAEYMPIIVGVQAAILAFTERVQGGASKE